MAHSSTPSLADFAMLLSDNLLNIEQQAPLEMSTVLALYKMHFPSEYEWIIGCIDTYSKLACDETAMYTGILTLISAISDSTFYIDECNGQERPTNMYVHIIDESGTYLYENKHVIAINCCLVHIMSTLPFLSGRKSHFYCPFT